jgi:hypothetical protein
MAITKSIGGAALTHAQMNANFDEVTSTTTIANTATTNIASLEQRITTLETAPTAPAEYSYVITAADTVAGGSSGTDDDVVIVSSDAVANLTKISLLVTYTLETGAAVIFVDRVLQTLNFASIFNYNLSIPVFRDYLGSKISVVTISVFDDPAIENARTLAIIEKIITIVDPTPSMSSAVASVQTDEGATQTVVVNTQNMETGRTVNYVITSDDADVATDITTPATGALTVTANAGDGLGSVSLDVAIVSDTLTEGDETLIVTFTDAIVPAVTTVANVIINDSSRATETWTLGDWTTALNLAASNTLTGGSTVADQIALHETLRSNTLALTTPVDLVLTSAEVYLLMIKKSWIDGATLVSLPTSDTAYVTNLNGYINTYNTTIASMGITNANAGLGTKRPSGSTDPEDDIAWTWLQSNVNTPQTAATIIYTGVEANPNDII